MNRTYSWYKRLAKPSWAPPSWLFGPVWTFLYLIITISFGYVFLKVLGGTWPAILAIPFLLNLGTNLLFTHLQFKLRNNFLAAADITAAVLTLVWAMLLVYPVASWVAYVNIPYLLWGVFATALQYTVTYLNYKR